MPRQPQDPKVKELVDILSDMKWERSPEEIRSICQKLRKIDGKYLLDSRPRTLVDKYYNHWLREYNRAVTNRDLGECSHCRDECDKWRKVSMVVIKGIAKWMESNREISTQETKA